MALLDSAAEFASRATELGLGAFVERLAEIGVKTMADLAYCTDYTPGSTDVELFNTDLLMPVLGEPASPHRPALKRLFVEAYTLAASDLKRKMDPQSDTVSDARLRLELCTVLILVKAVAGDRHPGPRGLPYECEYRYHA